MRARIFLSLLLAFSVPQLLSARLTRQWSYQEMFDNADLVVIATVLSTKDTGERTTLPDYDPSLVVIGVTTEFKSLVVLKGAKGITKFQLHHYRYRSANDEFAVANTPNLVRVGAGKDFFLFLVKESDGRYAPVTGQTDPAGLSVLDLKGAAN
jgi:hypothetical protein